MEMPGGWNKLIVCEPEAGWNKFSQEELIEALYLMKEMAEALDDIVNPKDVPSIKFQDDPQFSYGAADELRLKTGGDFDLFPNARKVLNKFKEWK